ncbi:MAG: ABC transporter ATP-binding protein/permease [Eubacterium sp.]|nr:ABC transporter ATP-binding protein/permease [Eubacterium sp.]
MSLFYKETEWVEDNPVEHADEYVKIFGRGKGHPVRTFFNLYKGTYWRFLLAGFLFILKNSPVWVLPIVTSNIINIATNPTKHSSTEIVLNIAVIITLIAFNFPLNYLFNVCQSTATRAVEAHLRSSLVRKIQQLSISFHKETESGRLQSKIIRDVEAIQALSSQIFTQMLTIFLNIFVALTVTVTRSLIVFVFFLITVPIAGATIGMFRKGIRRSNRAFRKQMEETSTRVVEMVDLIPVTRAHALENEEIKKMGDFLNGVAYRGYKLDIIHANFGAISWCMFQTFQVVCLAFTGYMAYKKNISVGEIAMYQSYFTTIVNQVAGLIMMLPNISKGTESITSIGEILLSDDVEDYTGKEKISSIHGDFNFKDVTFHYADAVDKDILYKFNLQVNAGETIALVGESGAGKTTILNLLIGFIRPTSGAIYLDGKNLDDLNLRTYRDFISVVPQNTILFSGTIRDNITYGMPDVTDEQLWAAIESANLKKFITELPNGLDTMIGENGGKLSGGQRQRLAIARALVRDPKIIIFDEATSALDSTSEHEIQLAIENMASTRTTFIVAHRLSTIRNADKIAVIGNGGCTEFGTYDELMELKGEFYHMRQLQSE